MKLAICGVWFTIVLVVSGQIDDDYSTPRYKVLDFEETIQPENDTKDGELEELFNNVTNTSESVVILSDNKERDNNESKFQRLNEIRGQFVYDFDESHYISGIKDPSSMIQMDLGFQLPFFGARYRFVNVSLDGTIYFSEKPNNEISLPIIFPLPDWPVKKDPALIAILLTKTSIMDLNTTNGDLQKPGVYCRHVTFPNVNYDIETIKLRERIWWDIRQGMVGANTFHPRHAVIVTWKNVSQADVVRSSRYSYLTNSFQMILATDEHQTYVIFNYIQIQWDGLRDRKAGTNDSTGMPAFVGFNAGNGRQSFEYKPFSQTIFGIPDLKVKGGTNNFPGRHIFRIDEEIVSGTCYRDVASSNISLVFAPQSGNMMGGTMVNVTGPCFHQSVPVLCRFDTSVVPARIIDRNRAVCVQPMLYVQGWVSFDVAIGAGEYLNQGWYYVETPSTAEKTITFPTNQVFKKFEYHKWETIPIQWNPFDISDIHFDNITISLWGYDDSRSGLVHIAVIDQGPFFGGYEIFPHGLNLREDPRMYIQFGLLRISITNKLGDLDTPSIWSKPIPLAWYFGRQWERKYGKDWASDICDQQNQMSNVPFIVQPACPCTLKEAENDRAFLLPDPDCTKSFKEKWPCIRNPGAAQCLRSSQIGLYDQQCCYNNDGYLMSVLDEVGGSRPSRSSTFGGKRFTELWNIPSLSTWYADISPYYMCCVFQNEQSEGCVTYRIKKRFTSDCRKYNPPKIAAVYGDPHFLTFDQQNYTFNGMGEFVLVRSNWSGLSFDVQGRFEVTKQRAQGWSMGTRMTSIVTKGNSAVIVEVRQRPDETQWRLRLDVIINGRKVYFDSPSRKVQHFDEVTVYTPADDVDQSHVIIMLANGNGVEVQERDGMMAARVYLSSKLANTTGLLGSANGNAADDFMLPIGEVLKIDPMNLRATHENYGIHWRITKSLGESLFFHDSYRTASHQNIEITPIFERDVLATMFNIDSPFVRDAYDLCDDNFECLFDFGTTLNASYAKSTLLFQKATNNIVSIFNERTISCGYLPPPEHGRKLSFNMMLGAHVLFTCDDGYYLSGYDDSSICAATGEWTAHYTECKRNSFDLDISNQQYYGEESTVEQKILVALGIWLMLSGVIVCIIWRRRSLQRRSRLQGNLYEQIAGDYLDDDLVEWEVNSKADKQS